MNTIDFLKGKTLTKIDGEEGDGELFFFISDGDVLKMYHEKDCCESVYLEDICGDLDNLIGSPILVAEERTNRDDPPIDERYDESWTWTFYEISTLKGSVTLRWYGESNGYYSEDVDIEVFKPTGPIDVQHSR